MAPHFELDYTALDRLGRKTYKLSDVKDKLIRVAFDVVRFSDSPINEFWQVQECQDGDYIVARYNEDEAEGEKKEAKKLPWSAIEKQGEVHLFYKGAAFTKIAHQDAETVSNFLPERLSTDKNFVSALLQSLPQEKQEEVKTLYPELF